MEDKQNKTLAEVGADLRNALYRLRDALLEPFVPVEQAFERLLDGKFND